MAFPTATLGGETITLLSPVLQWDSVVLEHEFQTMIAAALSMRESRRKDRLAMRTKAQVNYLFDDRTEAADFRTMLATLVGDRVGLPLWMDVCTAGDYPSRYFDAQYYVRLDTWAIVAKGSIGGLTSTVEIAPLLIGTMDRPTVEPLDQERAAVTLVVQERRSKWEWRVEFRDDGETNAAFPDIEPNWVAPLDDVSADYVEYKELGRSRELLVVGTDAPMKWGQSASLSFSEENEMRAFFAFWQRCAGRYAKFTCPVWFRPHASATAETPDGIVGRFASDTLRVVWSTDIVADVEVNIWQLPWELSVPSGEAFQLPSRFYLYEVVERLPDYADGPQINRYTDCDQPITSNSLLYSPFPIEHDAIQETETFGGQKTQVMAGAIDGSIFLKFLQGECEGPVTLRIWRCDPESPDDAEELFFEEIHTVSLQDRELTIEAGGEEAPELPRMVVSREALNYPEELWQIRVGEIVGITDSQTKFWIDWDDSDLYQNPKNDRYNGWSIVLASDITTKKTITDHFQEIALSGASDSTVVIGAAWATPSIGDKVYILSPYVRIGEIQSILPDPLSAYAEKYLIDWADGGGNPANAYLDGGLIERIDNEPYEARDITLGFGAAPDSDHAIVTRLPFRGAAVGDTVLVWPGWDGTYTQLASKFPLALDWALLFPYTPYRNVTTEQRNPFDRPEYGGKK
jgi:hypothetical protein